jgi:hypothetical protein
LGGVLFRISRIEGYNILHFRRSQFWLLAPEVVPRLQSKREPAPIQHQFLTSVSSKLILVGGKNDREPGIQKIQGRFFKLRFFLS